ncbi:MAG TPA: hypothetical protein VMF55_05320 [Solirubrobacterales bacterium]|nr:hypothetical protein [Solirubrobacterales bacterium]
MKLVRAAAPVLSILVLAGLLAAVVAMPSAARPKASFKPKVGGYIGTVTIAGAGAAVPIMGNVFKEGKNYSVAVYGSSTETCDNGVVYPAGFSLPVPVSGKSFSVEETGTDSFTGGKATWKIAGHFTGEAGFTGSAGRTSVGSTKDTSIHSCTMKSAKFTLKWKTPKALAP